MNLLQEAAQMPDASIRFAEGIYQVMTPEELISLRSEVRERYSGQFSQLQAAINERFGTTGARDNFVNVFYAAGEMALMEEVGRARLQSEDRRRLRHLWESLLHAT